MKILNRYLPDFPGPENTEIDEGGLIDIVVSMCPAKWRHEMVKDHFEPAEHTLEEVQTRLEMIEVVEDIESTSLEKKTPKKEDHSKNYPPYKKKSNNWKKPENRSEDSKPPCKLCNVLGKNGTTHSFNDCFRKKNVESKWNSSKESKNGYKKRKLPYVTTEEMNAIVIKRTKRLVKKQFKKSGLQYASSTDSSIDEP